jgi:hypothetical protein
MGKVANTGRPPKSTRGWSESPAWRGPWAGSRSAAGNLGARRGAQMRQRLDGLPAGWLEWRMMIVASTTALPPIGKALPRAGKALLPASEALPLACRGTASDRHDGASRRQALASARQALASPGKAAASPWYSPASPGHGAASQWQGASLPNPPPPHTTPLSATRSRAKREASASITMRTRAVLR